LYMKKTKKKKILHIKTNVNIDNIILIILGMHFFFSSLVWLWDFSYLDGGVLPNRFLDTDEADLG